MSNSNLIVVLDECNSAFHLEHKEILVSNIAWDTEDSLGTSESPSTEMRLLIAVPFDDRDDEETLEELISDGITKLTGFCHDGFSWAYAGKDAVAGKQHESLADG